METQENALMQAPIEESAKQEQPFEATDYLRELFLYAVEQQKSDKKRLYWTRLCGISMTIVAALLIVIAVIYMPKVNETLAQVDQTLAFVQGVDVDKVIGEVTNFTSQAGDSLKAVGEAASVLEGIDISALNGAITELEKTVESFSEIDVKTLNAAIKNLNDTVEPFAAFFAKFKTP